ncbi:MAG TPA: GNAT family N-acetyltransferase [Gammaproteobacteria bacterium]
MQQGQHTPAEPRLTAPTHGHDPSTANEGRTCAHCAGSPVPHADSLVRRVAVRVFCRKLQDPCSYLLVAEDETGLASYVSGYCHAAFYAGGNTAWIDEIFVKEERRGEGIGRLLMAALETRAAEDGCTLVALATAGAAPFYSKIGYESKAGYFKKYLTRT